MYTLCHGSKYLRDGPLEKIWWGGGGGGKFSSRRNFFFRNQILCKNFLGHRMNIL